MKTRMFKGVMVCLAILGVCSVAAAAGPAVTDVALRDGGVLIGQVVNPQGVAQEGASVALRYQDQQWISAKTGKDGYFAFKGLRGGVYQVASGEGHGVYRAWTPGTAPPAAQEGALVVSGPVTRGQECCPPQPAYPRLRAFVTNPLVIAGAVATAIAVPVAIHNADDDEPTSP